DRSSSMRWFIGFGAIVLAAIILDPWIVAQVPASWSSPPSWPVPDHLPGPALFVFLLIRFVDGQRLTAQEESRHLLQDMLPGRLPQPLAGGQQLVPQAPHDGRRPF